MTKKNTARLAVDQSDPLLSPTLAVQRQRAAEENFNWPPPDPAGSPKHRVSSQWMPAGHEKEYAMMKENDPPTQGIHWFPVRSGNQKDDSMAMVGENGLAQGSMVSLEESFDAQTNLNDFDGIAGQNSSFISQKPNKGAAESPTKIVQDSRKPPSGVNRAYSQKGTSSFAFDGPNHSTRTQSQLRELVHSPGPNKYLPNIKATRVEIAKNIKFTGGDRQSTMFPFARNEPCTLGLPGPGAYFQQVTSPPPKPRMKKKKKKKATAETTNPPELPDPLEIELESMEVGKTKSGKKKKHVRSKSAGGFVSSFGLTWVNGMPMERVQDGRKRSTMDTQAPVNSSMRSKTPNHLPPTSAAKQKATAETPSPGAYTPNINIKYKRYASFGFGSSARKTVFDCKGESPGPQYFPDYAFTSQVANPPAAPIGGHVGGGKPMHSMHSPPRPATHLGNARGPNKKPKAKKRIMEAQKAGSVTVTEDSEGSVIGMMDLDNQPVFDATEGSESGSVSIADSVILRTSLDKKVKETKKVKGQRINPHRPRVKDPPKFADPGTYSPNYSLIFKSSFGPKIGSESRMKWMGNWEGTKGNSPGPKYNPRSVFNSEHERAPGAMLNLNEKRLLDHPENMYATAQVTVPEMNYHEKKKKGKNHEEENVDGSLTEKSNQGDRDEQAHEAQTPGEVKERPKSANDILDEATSSAHPDEEDEKMQEKHVSDGNEGPEEIDGVDEGDGQEDEYDDFEDDDVEIEPLAEDLGESVRPTDKENLAAEMLHDDNLWAGVEENYDEEFEEAESSMEGSRGQSRGEDRTASIISNKNPMYADEDIGERTGTRAATRTGTNSRGRSRGSGPTVSMGENSTSLATFNEEDDAGEASGEYVEDPEDENEGGGNGNGFDGMFA